MKKLIIFAIVILGLYSFITWKPLTSSIVNEMSFGNNLSFDGVTFHSDWGAPEIIVGTLRRIDRHYSKHVPIITYDLVITTEEFSDPDIVKITHKGDGNYYWSSHKKPKGTLVFYHTVPNSVLSQEKLDDLKEGEYVKIFASVSSNNAIKSSAGANIKLAHNNHKFILVETVL